MRLIDADALHKAYMELRNFKQDPQSGDWISLRAVPLTTVIRMLNDTPSIDIVRCKECRKSHIDGKTTHYLWCTEWGRSTDTFGYCERGEREGE